MQKVNKLTIYHGTREDTEGEKAYKFLGYIKEGGGACNHFGYKGGYRRQKRI